MSSPDMQVFDSTDVAIRLLEEERRRMARDLHDGPAQGLTNVSMRMDVIQNLLKSNPEMAAAELARTNSRVISVINEIRRLIYDLRPVAIDEVGLVPAVREMIRRFERESPIKHVLEVAPDVTDDIAPAKQVAVYRLIQEILHNIHKHAQADLIQVTFSRDHQDLTVKLQDNGKGFDPSVIPTGHYGIIGMKERASLLGGQLRIESTIGIGSTFFVTVPVYR